MTRLIDADAIEYHMMAKEDWLGCTVEDSEMVWKVDIDAMPTVDAVPVIRCKDCKWYGDGYLCYNTETLGMQPDDYCSLAEREEE